MEFIDTHTHPHMVGYELSIEEFRHRAREAGVTRLICVGTDATDSAQALAFAGSDPGYYASIGLHPHEASKYRADKDRLAELAMEPGVVAIGECGLDYYYEHSPREAQELALRGQLELAQTCGLPLIFHVRDAFNDFFRIFDEYHQNSKIKGVIHSFTADQSVMEGCVARGLHIGLNGIMTFTKDESQLEAARRVPTDKLLLETDSPFLTPVPFRGKVNHSGHVRTVAEFLSNLRNQPLKELAMNTSTNAKELFGI